MTTPSHLSCQIYLAAISGCNPAVLPSCTEGLKATDACDGEVAVVCTPGEVTGDGCGKQQIFTYSATDACGNTATGTATYTWKVDTEAPVLTGCPTDNPTVQCYADVPAAATVTALDGCDGAIDVVFKETQSNPGSSCNNIITRTWTAVDECDNEASCTQTITVEDTEAPAMTLPIGGDLGCNNPPVCADIIAEDNCDGQIPVGCTPGEVAYDGCIATQTFTYTAEDVCGNTASGTVPTPGQKTPKSQRSPARQIKTSPPWPI